MKWRYIFTALLATFSLAHADNNQPQNIQLERCSYANQFYCIKVHGGAFKELPTSARFDSGSSALSVPESCLDPNKITVLQANVQNNFNRPADLVKGDIALQTTDGKMIHVTDMHFFALKNVPCQAKKDVGTNFGAFTSGSMSRETSSPKCVTDFFTLYTANSQAESPFGYVFNDQSNQITLSVGPINSYTPSQQLTPLAENNCADRQNINLFSGPASPTIDWQGPTAIGFNVMINGIEVPTTPLPEGANPSLSSNLIGMIDSGGGMTILSDDEKLTVTNTINSNGTVLTTKNCGNISWLQGCKCLNAGLPISVSNDILNIKYTFNSTDINDQRNALAVCPTGKGPYIVPNGVNLGFPLFNRYNIGVDYQYGRLLFGSK